MHFSGRAATNPIKYNYQTIKEINLDQNLETDKYRPQHNLRDMHRPKSILIQMI